MNREDPIVEVVRTTRERLLEESGGFNNYIAKLKALESSEQHLVAATGKILRDSLDTVNCAEEQMPYRK